jgi:2-desacetyl-2-hydroxyethyl bacteriochlorophyllide A dehydrogenase
MRAVRHTVSGIEVLDRPEPSGPGVVLRVRGAGICGSDLHLLTWGPSAVTLGHEIGGTLTDGTRVAIWPSRPCGTCDRCVAGHIAQCRVGAASGYGIGADGGMADRMLVDERNVVVLPDSVAPADGALVEPLACGVHALRRAGLGAGDRVAIVGAGAIGLGCAAVAGWFGAVVAVGARHPAQIDAARALGASVAPRGEYDVVVDAAGTSASLDACLRLVRPGGTVALVATYWEPITMPALFTMKEPTLVAATSHGDHDDGHDMATAVRVLVDRPEVAPALITHRLPLERAAEAFRVAADRAAGAIKVVLEP